MILGRLAAFRARKCVASSLLRVALLYLGVDYCTAPKAAVKDAASWLNMTASAVVRFLPRRVRLVSMDWLCPRMYNGGAEDEELFFA